MRIAVVNDNNNGTKRSCAGKTYNDYRKFNFQVNQNFFTKENVWELIGHIHTYIENMKSQGK